MNEEKSICLKTRIIVVLINKLYFIFVWWRGWVFCNKIDWVSESETCYSFGVF